MQDGKRKLQPLFVIVVIAIFACSTYVARSVAADQPANSRTGAQNSSSTGGLSLRGYDPVAYFTVGRPTLGLATITAEHNGHKYRFATLSNRDAFVRAPERYAPQYDGFCAMGASMAKKFEGDPLLWRIINGKLYLNVGAEAAKRWREDIAGNIAAADKAWPDIRLTAEDKL